PGVTLCVNESGIDGEALVWRERGCGAEREQRIAADRGADVEVAVTLDDRDLVAGGALAEHDRGPVGQFRVAELEGAGAETTDAARTREQPARGGEGLRVVERADGEDERFRVLRNGEEAGALVGVEAVRFGRLGIEGVETGGVADRAGDLVEEGAERELAGDLAVQRNLLPRRRQHQGGADVAWDGHGHRAARCDDVRAGGPRRGVLVADGFDDGADARPRKRVGDLHAGGLRAVAEVPDDLAAFGDCFPLAERDWNRSVGG